MVETERYYDPDWRDRWFAWRHGFDVEGIIEQSDYGPADESTLARATFYQPIPVRYLANLLTAGDEANIQPRKIWRPSCRRAR